MGFAGALHGKAETKQVQLARSTLVTKVLVMSAGSLLALTWLASGVLLRS